jgi:hypothetical protein
MTYYHPPMNSAYPTCCPEARTFGQFIRETIFSNITGRTTPEQFEAAQYSLLTLYQRLEANLDPFHYKAAVGTHECIRDVYTDAAYRLKHRAIMHQEPLPEPPPKQQLITLSGVVIDLEEEYYTSREETDLGTDDDSPHPRRNR